MTEAALDNPAPGTGDIVDPNIIDTPADKAPVVPQTWPDNWRHELSGGDEKELKRLERMKSPADVYKSYRELERLKSSYTPPPKKPGEGATPEEIKAYRDHAGIPDDPKGYDLNFDDGTAIGEDMMPYVEGFLKHAHDSGLPKDVVKSTLKFYMEDVAREQSKIASLNDEARVNGITNLKSEWGAEFKGNMNAIQSLFTEAPEGVMQSLLNARDESGLKFANNEANIRWLVGLAKSINPTASLLPAGANDASSIDTELEKLQGQMNSQDKAERDKYWKDPKAQARYLALTQAKQKNR